MIHPRIDTRCYFNVNMHVYFVCITKGMELINYAIATNVNHLYVARRFSRDVFLWQQMEFAFTNEHNVLVNATRDNSYAVLLPILRSIYSCTQNWKWFYNAFWCLSCLYPPQTKALLYRVRGHKLCIELFYILSPIQSYPTCICCVFLGTISFGL